MNGHLYKPKTINKPTCSFYAFLELKIVAMIAIFVHIWVKKKHIHEFLEATVANHNQSVREPGNLRFDILRDAAEPNKFVLYEAYESEEAAAAHKSTQHYLTWRDTVEDWMKKPREGRKHMILYPKDKEQW